MVNVLSLCFSALFLSNLALIGASNSRGRRLHNSHAEGVQKRAAEEHHGAILAARSGSTAAAVARKRALGGRCKGRNSTTTLTSSTTVAIGNPGGNPTSTSTRSRRHRTRTLTTTTTDKDTSPPESTSSPPATTTKAGGGGNGGGGSGTYSGEGTYYGTGLGSCGWTNKDTDYIAAVSQLLYDTWPGATGNPNNNPICGRYATAYYGGKSVRVKIVDRCVGCAKYDLDFSPAAFKQIADQALGRIQITWDWS
jgi:hypothetical protein